MIFGTLLGPKLPTGFFSLSSRRTCPSPSGRGGWAIEINLGENVDKDIDTKSVGPGNMDGRVNNIPRN